MTVEPVTIAAGVANITSILPLLQDSLVYFANFMVSNTIGVLALGMVTISFGAALIMRVVKGRRGRK